MDNSRMPDPESAEDLSRLLESRRQIEGWLDRLDGQAGSASRKIIERVRADYRERLEEVTDEILRRQDLVSRWMAEAEQRVEDATARRESAAGQLEEARLRHQIGEWNAERWERLRAEYEATIAEASEEEEAASRDLARLRELLEAGAPPAPASQAADPPPEAGDDHQSDADDFTVVAASPNSGPEPLPAQRTTPHRIEPAAPQPSPSGDEADLENVAGDAEPPVRPPATAEDADDLSEGEGDDGGWASEEVPDDVTLVPETMPSSSAPDSGGGEEFDPETVPKPGIKCSNCGYTNDATAWFCGVCGADIG